MSHDVLFLPGPTEVRPEILAALAQPQIGHRSERAKELIASLHQRLRLVFGAREGVALFETCPATMLMEAAIRNLVPRRSLHLTCGAFSERWRDVALACGREVDTLAVDWGHGHTAALLSQRLATERYDAVAITHNETSTGVIEPLRELAAVVRQHPDVLVLVDAVTSLAGAPLRFDEWGLDLVFASTQKCLALPPGLTVYAVSPRALARAQQTPGRGWLMDLVRAAQAADKRETPATPSMPHLFALDVQLDAILTETMPARWARHSVMAERVRTWATQRGLALFAHRECLSPTVTTINAGTLDVAALRAAVKREGFVIADGYGKLKGLTLRIGHMGDHTLAGVDVLLAALDRALVALGQRGA